MGCTVAVVKHRAQFGGRNQSGSIKRTKKESVNFNDAITKLNLNERQIFQLQQSWKGIARKMEYTGVNMFVRIFELHEDLKKFFLVIQNCDTIAEIRESKGLNKHVLGVMHTLDDTIYNLDDMQYVTELLTDLGKQHRQFVDFRREFFLNSTLYSTEMWRQAITEPFLLAVKETLGDRYTRNIATIYRSLIQFIICTMFQGFGDKSDQTPNNCPAIKE